MTIVCNSPPVFYFLARSCVCDSIYNTTFSCFFFNIFYFLFCLIVETEQNRKYLWEYWEISRAPEPDRVLYSPFITSSQPFFPPFPSSVSGLYTTGTGRTWTKKKSQMTKQKDDSLFFLNLFYFVFLDSKNKQILSHLISHFSFLLWNIIIIIINLFCCAIKSVRQFFPSFIWKIAPFFFSILVCLIMMTFPVCLFIVQTPPDWVWQRFERDGRAFDPPYFSLLPHDCTIPSLWRKKNYSLLSSTTPQRTPPPFDQ
jgi:hypothetical protein